MSSEATARSLALIKELMQDPVFDEYLAYMRLYINCKQIFAEASRLTALEQAVHQHRWESICYCHTDYCCCEPACLACHWHQDEGHASGCWLVPLLNTENTNA